MNTLKSSLWTQNFAFLAGNHLKETLIQTFFPMKLNKFSQGAVWKGPRLYCVFLPLIMPLTLSHLFGDVFIDIASNPEINLNTSQRQYIHLSSTNTTHTHTQNALTLTCRL